MSTEIEKHEAFEWLRQQAANGNFHAAHAAEGWHDALKAAPTTVCTPQMEHAADVYVQGHKKFLGIFSTWTWAGAWAAMYQVWAATQPYASTSWKVAQFDRWEAFARENGYNGVGDALVQLVCAIKNERLLATFQNRVAQWMRATFAEQPAEQDLHERSDRFCEEAIELLQSLGYDAERIKTTVEYVYGRPPGDPAQEVGGTMVTLAALCHVADLEMHTDGEQELDRIHDPYVRVAIQQKHATRRGDAAREARVLGMPSIMGAPYGDDAR